MLLVGFVVSWWVVAFGAAITLLFVFLWVRDLTRGSELTKAAPAVQSEKKLPRAAEAVPRAPRAATEHEVSRHVFLEGTTLGLGAVIGALVTLPVLGFMVGPAFLKQSVKSQDLGPIKDFPEGNFLITTFTSNPDEGEVSRRTAFIRNNGFLGKQPSFTIISNHCAHLGCPVAPNGSPSSRARPTTVT